MAWLSQQTHSDPELAALFDQSEIDPPGISITIEEERGRPQPMKCLSVRQPWATLIVLGRKPVENRTWKTNYRGELLIHASKKFDTEGWEWMMKHGRFNLFQTMLLTSTRYAPRGGIIGKVNLVDIRFADPECDLYPEDKDIDAWWDRNQYGWILKDAKQFPLMPLKGKQGLFEVIYE